MNYKTLFLLTVLCSAVTIKESNCARILRPSNHMIQSDKKPRKSEFSARMFNHKKISISKNAISYSIPTRYFWIDEHSFEYHKSFFSISIPNGIQVVDDYAFFGCSRIKSLTFHNKLEYIGKFAFSNCNILSCIEIPGSILPENIHFTMFDGCKMLRNVNIRPVNKTISENLEDAIILAVAYKHTKPSRNDYDGQIRISEAIRLADA